MKIICLDSSNFVRDKNEKIDIWNYRKLIIEDDREITVFCLRSTVIFLAHLFDGFINFQNNKTIIGFDFVILFLDTVGKVFQNEWDLGHRIFKKKKISYYYLMEFFGRYLICYVW